ncbi:MAG: PilZ domain-containing protein [Deltaproteobacteria bacterium]|nr:PilZ domain-containing protein [Deltaproteobacteria bacterium]
MGRDTERVDQLRLVTLCYRYASLRSRERSGPSLSRAERIVWAVLQRQLEGDPERSRRAHRRIRLALAAELQHLGAARPIELANISGSGMRVVTDQTLSPGTEVLVRVGDGRELEYLFHCTVARQAPDEEGAGLGLRFSRAPVERHPGEADEQAAV